MSSLAVDTRRHDSAGDQASSFPGPGRQEGPSAEASVLSPADNIRTLRTLFCLYIVNTQTSLELQWRTSIAYRRVWACPVVDEAIPERKVNPHTPRHSSMLHSGEGGTVRERRTLGVHLCTPQSR